MSATPLGQESTTFPLTTTAEESNNFSITETILHQLKPALIAATTSVRNLSARVSDYANTTQDLPGRIQQLENALFHAIGQKNASEEKLVSLSRKYHAANAFINSIPENLLTPNAIRKAKEISKKGFHETINLAAEGPYCSNKFQLNAGTTWDELIVNDMQYCATCIIPGEDSFLIFTKNLIAGRKSDRNFCPIPTGKFVGKQILEAKQYLLNPGENKVNILFPLKIANGRCSVCVIRDFTEGEVEYISFLESGPLLNGVKNKERLSTKYSAIQGQLSSIQNALSLEDPSDRTVNLIDHRNNTDDAYMTLGAQFGILSEQERLELFQQNDKIFLVKATDLQAGIHSGKKKFSNEKQRLAFTVFMKNLGSCIQKCLQDQRTFVPPGFYDVEEKFQEILRSNSKQNISLSQLGEEAHLENELTEAAKSSSSDTSSNTSSKMSSEEPESFVVI